MNKNIIIIQGCGSLFSFIAASYIAYKNGIDYLGIVGGCLGYMSIFSALLSFGLPEYIQMTYAKNNNTIMNVDIPAYGILLTAILLYFCAIYFSPILFKKVDVAMLLIFAAFFCVINEINSRLLFQDGNYFRGQLNASLPNVFLWILLLIDFTYFRHDNLIALCFFVAWLIGVILNNRIMQVPFNNLTLKFFPDKIGLKILINRIYISIYDSSVQVLFAGQNNSISGVAMYVNRLMGPISMVAGSIISVDQKKNFSGNIVVSEIKKKCISVFLLYLMCGVFSLLLMGCVVKYNLLSNTNPLKKIDFIIFVLLILIKIFYMIFQYASQVTLANSNPYKLMPLFSILIVYVAFEKYFINATSMVLMLVILLIISIAISLVAVLSVGENYEYKSACLCFNFGFGWCRGNYCSFNE